MNLDECPYRVGAEFMLLLVSPHDCENHSFQQFIRVKVLQTFTFTRSQTMKVEILANSDHYDLPLIAFLKLYDRRYLEERAGENATLPWSPQREKAADEFAEKIRARLDARRISNSASNTPVSRNHAGVVENDYDNSDYDEDDYEQEVDSMELSTDDTMAVELWKNECIYRSFTKQWFDTECRAYMRLRALQGVCIPRFYGTTTFDETALNPPGVHSEVRGILLEFIDGVSLEELESNSPLALANPHLGETTVKLFERIVALGVLHGDVRPANIMTTPDGRLFLIDFGLAVIHQDESEDVWNERVILEGEISLIKLLLHRQELRDRTPPEPYPNFRASYETFNSGH